MIKINPLLLSAAMLPVAAFAGTVTKADNTVNLDLATSWNGGVPPISTDVADFSGAYNTAGALSSAFTASTPVSWQGISIGSLSGTAADLVSIGGTGAAVTGSAVTIGSSGIDMSAATQSLVINAATINANTSQTWNVASGMNLRLNTNAGSATLAGTGGNNALGLGTIITVSGSGVVDANQGGASGFADAAGFAGYTGKWIVNSGATLRGSRNGSTAWGSNTGADAITLNGGTLAVGGISGTQGTWVWNTNITLATSTSSTIDNQIFSGASRSLKLMGTFTGSGALTFNSTGPATMDVNNGFILTGTNTNTGTVTINSGAFLRVGGVNTANDITTGAGASGTLGDGSATNNVVDNGTLSFTRSNAHTVANAISGSGSVKIGTGNIVSATQVATFTGTNTYTGSTTVNSGIAQFAKEVSLYNNNTASWTATNVNVASAATAAFNVGGTGEFTSADIDIIKGLTSVVSGTTSANGFRNGSSLGLDTTNAAGGSFTYASNITNHVAGATIDTLGLTKLGTGTLVLSGANTYTGGTTITAGTVRASNAGALGTGTINIGTATLASDSATARTFTNAVFLNTGGATSTFGDATGTGALTFTGTLALSGSGTARTVNTFVDTTFTGAVTGSSTTAFTKSGNATLTLGGTGTVAISGATTVSAGTLLANGATALGSTAGTGLTVASGATLGGTGSIFEAATINGNITGGTDGAIGTLSTGALTLNGTYKLDLNSTASTADRLTSSGALALGGASILTLNDLNLAGSTSTNLIVASGTSLTGTFTGLAQGASVDGGLYTIDYGTVNLNAITLIAVPEPSTYGLIGAGALAAVAFVRRRRKAAGKAA